MPGPKVSAAQRERVRAARAAADGGLVWVAPTPVGLGDAGLALHKAIVGDVVEGYELDARELAILERACRLADLAADLEASIETEGMWVEGSTGRQRLNPAIGELRQCQSGVAMLLGKVELGPAAPTTGHLKQEAAQPVA